MADGYSGSFTDDLHKMQDAIDWISHRRWRCWLIKIISGGRIEFYDHG